ncbi:LOW QUALITY PROTEIN: hypothetical protein PHMEG_00020571 [Phytophthora megakarya]|uniref:Retrotransposon gag domain-containing protein n=1 Tax=Phytophthora megakarya TaxID=4795 RepID=A0A225VNK5_9STRA|nr:LOW QUALITY PROTEIN: hypothetical protein PHMEG_00020571 [Phytophthora megakarya]
MRVRDGSPNPMIRDQLQDLSQRSRGHPQEMPQRCQPPAFPDCPALRRLGIAASGARIHHRPHPGIHTFGDLESSEVSGRQQPGVMSPGMVFRPFITYDAVEPFDTSLSLDKRRAWWDKFPYTASSGGWREQELGTRFYSQLSHNPGTKAWVQQLPESIRQSWQQISDQFYKELCRSMESPVERYLRSTRLLTRPTCTTGCCLHVNQFLKNFRDREPQLSLQGRIYFTTDELEDVLKQVEEMEQGMARKPANDVQFGHHKPQGTDPVPQPVRVRGSMPPWWLPKFSSPRSRTPEI